MTYRKLNEIAEYKLDHGEITMGEFDEMTKPLDEEIRIWISCSERLPSTNGIYIVTRIIEAHFVVDVSYFDGSNTWHADNRINHSRDYLKDIVAWMPLPEPYKEGDSDAKR